MASNPPNKNHRPTFTDQEALLFHSHPRPGKLEVVATKPMATQRDLSLAYSPGVAVPVLAIAEDEALAYEYTIKGNFTSLTRRSSSVPVSSIPPAPVLGMTLIPHFNFQPLEPNALSRCKGGCGHVEKHLAI